MLDAKKKFREGFIMTKRPFKFANMKNPIQAFTVVWAYSEQPQIRPELTQTARENWMRSSLLQTQSVSLALYKEMSGSKKKSIMF